jgi:hypothetical protein
MNGTTGTDHGSATAAILVGGALKGGRVLADWPCLSSRNLFQDRDLKPTIDLRAVLKGLLRDHIGVPERALANTVFPQTGQLKPIDGLVAQGIRGRQTPPGEAALPRSNYRTRSLRSVGEAVTSRERRS